MNDRRTAGNGSPLPVTTLPAAVLRAPASSAFRMPPAELAALLADMRRTCIDAEGVGIAAPQVGIGVRAALIFPPILPEPIELLDPRILGLTGVAHGSEGCLSLPGWRTRDLVRPAHVIVENHRRDGERYTFELTGFAARIACHEIDHLDGLLYIHRLAGPLLRSLVGSG